MIHKKLSLCPKQKTHRELILCAALKSAPGSPSIYMDTNSLCHPIWSLCHPCLPCKDSRTYNNETQQDAACQAITSLVPQVPWEHPWRMQLLNPHFCTDLSFIQAFLKCVFKSLWDSEEGGSLSSKDKPWPCISSACIVEERHSSFTAVDIPLKVVQSLLSPLQK